MLKTLACFFSIFALATTAFPAEVKKISKKTGALYINEGSLKGFVKGTRVCVFDAQKKVACGKVTKAVKTKAIVRVPKSKRDKIKTGFVVAIKETKKSKQPPSPPPIATPYSMSIALNVHFLPMTPASYENLDYDAPAAGNTSLWKSIETASSIMIPPAFGLEFELINLGIAVGFRYGVYKGSSQADYYDVSQPNLTLTADTTTSDIGLYFDYIYYKRWDINFALGLDIDFTSLTFNGTQTDDKNADVSNNLFDATSSLKVLSLRVPFVYKYSFGSFGLSCALDLMIPFYAMGPSQTSTTPTTSITGLNLQSPSPSKLVPNQDDDLKSSFNHQKNSFAADIVLGMFYQF